MYISEPSKKHFPLIRRRVLKKHHWGQRGRVYGERGEREWKGNRKEGKGKEEIGEGGEGMGKREGEGKEK